MDYTITYRILNDEENDKDEVMTMNADFSRTLALLRQEKGISQRQAAGALGISQALLSHYENGIREPGLTFVVKACDYYGVSADYLLGLTDIDPSDEARKQRQRLTEEEQNEMHRYEEYLLWKRKK